MIEKVTILYVDDEPLNLMLFEASFKKKYYVVTAESGHRGLLLLQSNPDITIVISDMKMPGMNGIEFITQAKSEFPSKTYLILTGYNITEEISNALKNRLIFKYFRKPFNVGEIEEAIVEAIL